jgi:metal-dependent amidase/aminoacylase/carboxypeptidase family protein
MPHQTIDSIVVAAQIINALQTIVARNVNPIDSAVVTVGELHAGTAENVIADTAWMRGTVRYFNPELKACSTSESSKLLRESVRVMVLGMTWIIGHFTHQ